MFTRIIQSNNRTVKWVYLSLFINHRISFEADDGRHVRGLADPHCRFVMNHGFIQVLCTTRLAQCDAEIRVCRGRRRAKFAHVLFFDGEQHAEFPAETNEEEKRNAHVDEQGVAYIRVGLHRESDRITKWIKRRIKSFLLMLIVILVRTQVVHDPNRAPSVHQCKCTAAHN